MNISWIGTPNYTAGRGGEKVTGVIIHWMAGNLASADSVFQNRQRNTSAHYGVEDNTVHQYVKEEDTAYQAGNWLVNEATIGIEHSAQPGRDASDATYETSAQLIADIAKRQGFNITSSNARPHSLIVATQCPGTVSVDRLISRANELLGHTPAATSVSAPVNEGGTATVTVPLVYVRTSPSHIAPLGGSQRLTQGSTFDYVGPVQGESVSGISTWLLSTRGNYVWAGATNYPTTPAVMHSEGGTAEAVRVCNVRSLPSVSAPLAGSKQLQVGQTFDYSALVQGDYVSQNGVSSDLWFHSTVGNYVWSGNCRIK